MFTYSYRVSFHLLAK